MLTTLRNLPMGQACLTALFRRSSTVKLASLAKTLPWDHPVAQTLDRDLHRRKMAGKSGRFLLRVHLFFPSYPFSIGCRDFSRSRLSSASPLAHPPLPLPSTMSIELGSTFLGTNVFMSIFFLVSLTILEDKPVCHIYQWIARPTDGSVCNHCERMMDGYTLDDLIFHRGCSLTEDEVVAYVRRADPTQQDWDDWLLRMSMTYRINSFLRANGSNPEPDLNILNAF